MKLRVGNACWHAFHVQHALLCREAGFFAQEGIDVEIVHAKINPKAIESSRPGGERYDEVGTVLRDMVAFGIDIIPDESERIRDLTPMVMMEGHFSPLHGQLTAEGVWRILEEHLDAGCFRSPSPAPMWKT